MPTGLSVAIAHRADSLRMFPCRKGSTALPNGKLDRRPYMRWREEATTGQAKIRARWKRRPDAVPATPTGAASGLAVMDLDRKEGENGVTATEAPGFRVPAGSGIVDTPSGGRHVCLEYVDGVTNAAGHLPEGVEVRGEGGYVFAPEAVDNRGAYRPRGDFASSPVLGFPTALRAPTALPDVSVAPAGGLDPATRLSASGAIPCDGSHNEWNRVLMALHHETGGSAQGLALVQL